MKTMSIKIPTPEICKFFIERLPLLSEYEEHQMLDFAEALMGKGAKQKSISANHIAEGMSYLYHCGIISFTEKLTNHGIRPHYKRSASAEKILKLLSNPENVKMRKRSEVGGDVDLPTLSPSIQFKKKKKKKKKGLKDAQGEDNQLLTLASAFKDARTPSAESQPKKKKKKCCKNPHPVKSKKTGKRYCKNCGAKLKKKKKKV